MKTRLARLIPLLAEYEFEEIHIPGDENIFSDYLSRCGGTVNLYCDLLETKPQDVQAKNSERFCRMLANITSTQKQYTRLYTTQVNKKRYHTRLHQRLREARDDTFEEQRHTYSTYFSDNEDELYVPENEEERDNIKRDNMLALDNATELFK